VFHDERVSGFSAGKQLPHGLASQSHGLHQTPLSPITKSNHSKLCTGRLGLCRIFIKQMDALAALPFNLRANHKSHQDGSSEYTYREAFDKVEEANRSDVQWDRGQDCRSGGL
jgi:hypothetical protein